MGLGGDQPQETTPKEARINALLTQLRNIRGKNIDYFSATFPFSNDQKVEELLASIISNEKSLVADLKVGFVIGTGGLLILGKELDDIDVWIVVDRKESMLETAIEWAEYVESKPLVEDIRKLTLSPETQALQNIERQSYGSRHYLADQEQFDRSKVFLRKRNVAYICGDVT